MWKTVLAGSTALAIAGATLAYAQQGPGGRDVAPRWHAERAGYRRVRRRAHRGVACRFEAQP